MKLLRSFQENFIKEIIRPTEYTEKSNFLGMRIYQRNYHHNHIFSLKETYKNTLTLVGEEYFDVLANSYLNKNESKSGDLNDYGEKLFYFVLDDFNSLPEIEAISYLPDVVKLDWSIAKILNVGQKSHISLECMKRWDSEQQQKARIKLVESSVIIESYYPLYQIWLALKGIRDKVDLEEKSENIVLYRYKKHIRIIPLSEELTDFLKIWQINTLGLSLNLITKKYPEVSVKKLIEELNTLPIFASLWWQL